MIFFSVLGSSLSLEGGHKKESDKKTDEEEDKIDLKKRTWK